jgi:phosphoglucomutase
METTIAYQKAQAWSIDPCILKEDQNEILELMNNQNEVNERFLKDLEFGTGGMRGVVGLGSNRINRYTICKATKALVIQLLKEFNQSELSVCLSYDSRLSSRFLAEECASVLCAYGIKVHFFKECTAVPVLSFSVGELKAQAGIMLTASHNPPEYNGFKVYWQDGSQVTPPRDEEIVDNYLHHTELSTIKKISFNEAIKENLIHFVEADFIEIYGQKIKSIHPQQDLIKTQGSKLKIVYTPLHGTGAAAVMKLAPLWGFTNIFCVPSQEKPDGHFPTTNSPNPEDPKALTLAVEMMKEIHADIALASDPDTDRLGVAFKNKLGEISFLSGNEIGILLLEYILSHAKDVSHPLVLKTIVTSDLQTKICQNYNVTIKETLTGFKWMGKFMADLEAQKIPFTYLFGNEESYGYLPHHFSRDKDGVSAALLMMECALDLKMKNQTLDEKLDEIYEKYGYFAEEQLNFYFKGLDGNLFIEKIMNHLRTLSRSWREYTINKKEDYLLSKIQPHIPPNNVLCFELASGEKFFARPSGTEPKIKFYLHHYNGNKNLDEQKKESKEKLARLRQNINQEIEELKNE